MKHYHLEYEKRFNNSPAKEILLKFLLKIDLSKKRFISKFRSNEEHNQIVQIEGVIFDKKNPKRKSIPALYRIAWSPELGIACFKYLIQKFEIDEPKNPKEFEIFFDLTLAESESDQYIAQYRKKLYDFAILYSILYANFKFKKKFNDWIIQFLKKWQSHQKFGIRLNQIMPYLNVLPETVFNIFETFKGNNELLLFLDFSIGEFFENQPKLVDSYFDFFSPKKNYSFIIVFCYIQYYKDNKLLVFSNRKNKKARLYALKQIKFNTQEDLNKAIKIANGNIKSQPILSIRIIDNCIQHPILNQVLINKELDEIVKQILSSNEEDRKELLKEFLHIDNEYMQDCILKLIDQNPILVVDNIAFVIDYLLRNKINQSNRALEVIYKILDTDPKFNLSLFEQFIQSLEPIKFDELVVWILNHDNNMICKKIKDITSLDKTLKFTEESLESLQIKDLQYIVNKIVAFVFLADDLTSLVFSLLLSKNSNQYLETVVLDVFDRYIFFNYYYPYEFLNDKKKNGSDREKKIAKKILSNQRGLSAKKGNLKMIKELMISGKSMQALLKSRVQNANNNQANSNTNFFNIGRVIDIKASQKSTFKNSLGEYQKSQGMTTLTTPEIELPKGNYLDPIGKSKLIEKAINYKR